MSSSSNVPFTYTTKIVDEPTNTNLNSSAKDFKGISSQLTYKAMRKEDTSMPAAGLDI